MRNGSLLLIIILSAALFGAATDVVAQLPALPSGVTKWDASHKNSLKGSTTFFQNFEMEVLAAKPNDNRKDATVSADHEELIILKEGNLDMSIGGDHRVLGPGSIAFILPMGKYSYAGSGNTAAIFYRLKFKSKSPLDEQRGKANGESFMVDWKDLEMKKNERGGRRDFFNRPTSTCQKYEMHVTTLNEGLPSHPPHTHAEEEIILMISGNGTMEIAGKYYNTAPGDLVFVASNELHGIKNTGKGQCEYFAFQWK